MLFWVNSFCWIFEPREAHEHPFVTYDYQDEFMLNVLRAILKGKDIVAEKSRDMGVTWSILTVFLYLWQFHGRQIFLLLSRVSDLVDSPDQKSLFWKLDYLLKNQPGWLVPPYSRTDMHLGNLITGASIDGDSSNKFAGVAARYRAIYLDEFSKMQNQESINKGLRDVTRCRVYSFTPEGGHNTAAKIAKNPAFNPQTLHWSRHPDKRRGLYEVKEEGKIELIDKEFWTDDGRSRRTGNAYRFIRTSPKNPRFKYRSPWYDEQCGRTASETEIASELDIDYRGSEFQFFDSPTLEALERETCRAPLAIGHLRYDEITLEPLEFIDDPMGSWRFWIPMDSGLRPPDDRAFVVGIDVSWGTGASNSVLSFADCKTREKVAEFVSSRVPPEQLARVAIAGAKWFGGFGQRGAFMIWELNGPGSPFGNAIQQHGYSHFFLQKNEDTLGRRQSDRPGWQPGAQRGQAKTALLVEYRAMLYGRQYLNRSVEAIRECHQIIHLDQGGVGHAAAEQTEDPTASRRSHADRVTADALACKALGGYRARLLRGRTDQTGEDSPESREHAMRVGCMAARDQARFEAENPVDEW